MDTLSPALVGAHLGVPSELHHHGAFWPGNLPRVPKAQPLVGDLHLPAVTDLLVEHPELVADAVAYGRDAERGHGIEKAGRKAPQTTIAQPGFLFLVNQLLQVQAQLLHRLAHLGVDAQVDEIVFQVRPG